MAEYPDKLYLRGPLPPDEWQGIGAETYIDHDSLQDGDEVAEYILNTVRRASITRNISLDEVDFEPVRVVEGS